MSNKTLLYIELPPPIHGMTYINKIIYDNLSSKDEYVFYDTNFTADVNDVSSVSLKKIVKNISIMFGAWKAFFISKPRTVYSILSATKFGIIRDFAILLPTLIFKKRLVLHLHGFTYYKIYKYSKIYRYLFNILAKNGVIVVLCEKQQMTTLKTMGRESVVLPNCINKTVPIKQKVSNELLKICYISNISEQKGTLDLVKAVKNRQNIHLVIAGNFLDDKEEFLELIDSCENISYVGFADEKIKQEIFTSSDIFCLPSKLEEGSPISIIEAMSYGLPIIASDKGCIADMIEDVGFLLPEEYSVSDIRYAIENVKDNYEKLSKNTSRKYKKNYSQESFMQNLENILKGEIDV